jgi:hypothetical protein
MIRTAWLVLVVGVTALTAQAAGPRPSKVPAIVEVYNQVAERPLVKTPKGWMLDCEGSGLICPALVDEQNGFLSWGDEGTGGGGYLEEAALFTTADRRRVLLVSHTSNDGARFEHSVSAWDATDGKPRPLAPGVVPNLTVAEFANGTCSPEERKKNGLLEGWAFVGHALPRVGTTLQATLVYPFSDDEHVALTPEQHQEATKYFKKCYLASIPLPFDKQTGVFTRASKRDGATK